MKKRIKLEQNGYQSNFIGNAGQHLALFYLLMGGLPSHITEPGAPYDILTEYNNSYIRFQVKTLYRMNKGLFYRFRFIPSYYISKANEYLEKIDAYILVVLNQKLVSFVSKKDISGNSKYFRSKVIDYSKVCKRSAEAPIYLEDLTLPKFLQEYNKLGEQNANTGQN